MLVVIDTNILISSIIAPAGNEARIINSVRNQLIKVAVSPSLLQEYERVLSRRKFGFDPIDIDDALHPFRAYALIVHPTFSLAISPDEFDNRFLECAEAAGADFLVTGNGRHFPKRHGRTRIVSAREFLAAFDTSGLTFNEKRSENNSKSV